MAATTVALATAAVTACVIIIAAAGVNTVDAGAGAASALPPQHLPYRCDTDVRQRHEQQQPEHELAGDYCCVGHACIKRAEAEEHVEALQTKKPKHHTRKRAGVMLTAQQGRRHTLEQDVHTFKCMCLNSNTAVLSKDPGLLNVAMQLHPGLLVN